MADIYSKYDTGNDTTGDGSIGNPYKTLAKSLSVANTAVANNFYLMADEPQSTIWTLPTVAGYTLRQQVIGTDASGVVTGVRRVITSTGGLANSYTNGGTVTYSWSWLNIHWYGYSDYVQLQGANQVGMFFCNCKIESCKGIAVVGATSSTYKYVDCEWLNCASGTGAVGGGYGSMHYRCKFINCSATTGSIVIGSTALCKLYNSLFIGCSTTSGVLISLVEMMSDCIVDNCSMSSSTANDLISVGGNGTIANVLITNCSGGGNADQFVVSFASNAPSNLVSNIAFFNNTGFAGDIGKTATTTGIMINTPLVLDSNPFSDITNLIYAPDYPYRRNAVKIGEYNYTPTGI